MELQVTLILVYIALQVPLMAMKNKLEIYILIENKFCGEEARMGLFGNNYGVVKNLGLVNCNISLTVNDKTGDVGGLAAKNYNAIENCYVQGNLGIYGDESTTGLLRLGGISSGNENAIIRNTYFSGNITVNRTISTSASCSAGGITGGNTGEISKCYSAGTLSSKNIQYVAGIAANNDAKVKNCYNAMDINIEDGYACGGIVGWDKGSQNADVSYCYNKGNIIFNENGTERMGSLVGIYTGGKISRSYYLVNTLDAIGGMGSTEVNYEFEAKTEEQMKSESMIELLNLENEGIWSQDIDEINDGYPILN